MKKPAVVFTFSLLLLMPVYIDAQTFDRISLLDNFGNYDRGDQMFIFGNVANIDPDSFLILQIINPRGDMCQIQQLVPLSNGLFITDNIPLQGKICGVAGEYEVKLFYGDYSTSTKFVVLNKIFEEGSESEKFSDANQIILDKIQTVGEVTGASTLIYSETLNSISPNNLIALEELYADIWEDFFIEDELFEIDTKFRPAITSALDYTSVLVADGKLSFDLATKIDRGTYAAIFYSHLGDTKNAVTKLNDVFVQIRNVDPIKVPDKQPLTYRELEDALLNIMTKNQSIMSRDVKEEIAFIFSRGTGPLYANELDQMLDLLTQSRFLDVILRNTDPLYRLVQTEWEISRENIITKTSIEEFLESSEKVKELHQAALILRELDDVERFVSSDREENSELINLILPDWDDLRSDLELATSVDDIVNSEPEILNIKNVIEASSRISKAVEISRASGVNSSIVNNWENLLTQVENASSTGEILAIVSDFDSSINEMRTKRNPLGILKFEYEGLKAKAELQNDQKNLFMIKNALRIIDTAEKMAEGNPSVSKIDRIEVLLTWASAKAPEIKVELESYSQDAYKIRASDILQRAKSIENLADLSLRTKKFLPGYRDFVESMIEKVDEARALVIKNDLDAADNMVRSLFDEWRQVNQAYDDDPLGSDVGYSVDEIKRIEYRKKLDALSNTVSNFYNPDFAPYSDEFVKMTNEVSELIDYGNFIDAERKIKELNNFLSDNLTLNNQDIIFDISYDLEKDIWVMEGAINKPGDLRKQDRREDINLSVYNMEGKVHSTLEFSDTKYGDFFTQWQAPTDPGLYVVMLQYRDIKASQIVNVADKETYSFTNEELNDAELSREFEELKNFIESFGGKNYDAHSGRFVPVIEDIKRGLANRDSELVDDKLDDLKLLIERYLPVRSRSAIIEASIEGDHLYLSGAVQKTLSFREDLYVDIFDQQGNRVEEIGLKDNSSGRFNEILSIPLQPGVYVAQLEYHGLTVSDFFSIG